MENINFCPSCGTKIEGRPNFCPICGTKIYGSDPSSTAPKQSLKDIGEKVTKTVGDVTEKVTTKAKDISEKINTDEQANKFADSANALISKLGYNIKKLRPTTIIALIAGIAAVLLIMFILMISAVAGDSEDNYSSDSYEYSYGQESDSYQWLYGTWVLTIDGEQQKIAFYDNGNYLMFFNSRFGVTTEHGSFTIKGNSIRLQAYNDKYPSYIEIQGKRLKSDGHYYRKQ